MIISTKCPTNIILIPKTARRLFHPAQDYGTKRLQAEVGVVWDGHAEMQDESVQDLPLEVG